LPIGGEKSDGEVELVAAAVSPQLSWLFKETSISARQRIESLPKKQIAISPN